MHFDRFTNNLMLANAEKFQAMFLGLKVNLAPEINIRECRIMPEKEVKLLGVYLDQD